MDDIGDVNKTCDERTEKRRKLRKIIFDAIHVNNKSMIGVN